MNLLRWVSFSSAFMIIFIGVSAQACLTGADEIANGGNCDDTVSISELMNYIGEWYKCSSCVPDLFQSIQAYYGIPLPHGPCGDGICDTFENETGCPQDCVPYDGDSFLRLGDTGYAYLPDANVADLDYSRSFSVEALSRIEAFQAGGRWGTFIKKGGSAILWSSSVPGFGIGTYAGNSGSFSKRILAKVGDGTAHASVTSPEYYQGYVYVVLTWDAPARNLTLFVNGIRGAASDNSAISLSGIENGGELRMGKDQYNLRRDVFFARLWNRRLTESEISDIWDNYDTNGQHMLPSGFDESDLVSEWLMHQSSSADGSPGITHIKDTAGGNHLEIAGGAELFRGSGTLVMESPVDGAVGVDKAVFLNVSGGIETLGGGIVGPLQYFFQIDESSAFDSPALKESGWLRHFGRWKPVLKPNTKYYWRVKVGDSNAAREESSFFPTSEFTTEGPTSWYVRPLVDVDGSKDGLNNPMVDPGIYGSQDGTTYSNAWNGIFSIGWGEGGVEAGDTLHVCGDHIYHVYTTGYWAPPNIGYIKESGFSSQYPITITTGCPGDEGTVYGIAKNMNANPTWQGPDANGVYWTQDLDRRSVVEYDGTDYVWLDRENDTTWAGHAGSVFTTAKDAQPWLVNNTYLKTTDGSDPTGKIYVSYPWGFRFDLGRSSYIKFQDCKFYNSIVGKDKKSGTESEYNVSHHITYDGCELAYGGTQVSLYEGMDDWIVRNSDIHDSGEGIYTHTPGHVYNLLVENNMIHDIGPPNNPSPDCHAIGVQNGANHIIQNNTIWNTGGTAIEFHACSYTMKNMTVRNNFVKDMYVTCNTGGSGILVSGCNSDSWGMRTGFRIYNNIVMNTALGADAGWYGGTGIGSNNKDYVEVFNNVIINPFKHGISFVVLNPEGPPQGAIYNNIIVNPGSKYLNIHGVGDWENFSIDHNLYYNATDFITDFSFSQAIDRDNNSILADPMFVTAVEALSIREDFMLLPQSPAIDNGTDVGIPYDITGNPRDAYPDIGAYEHLP